MTVHKSQGSEYRAVILALGQCAPTLISRAVLYTAVTRAKSLLIVVGDDEVFAAMVANNRTQKRYSGLKTRLGA
jgi:exodeoxyribonuclease V alpha subunit